MSTNYYVYEHWRMDRDECFYVGKGKGARGYKMSDRNQHHRAIQAKVSRLGAGIEVRVVAGGLSEPAAFNLEKERIAFWLAAGADLANFTLGGEGPSGWRHTPEALSKMSLAKKGKSPPHSGTRGMKFSAETKAKMSLAKAGKAPNNAGKTYTKPPATAVARKNMSESKRRSYRERPELLGACSRAGKKGAAARWGLKSEEA